MCGEQIIHLLYLGNEANLPYIRTRKIVNHIYDVAFSLNIFRISARFSPLKNQLEEDKLQDQLTFREYEDTFKGNYATDQITIIHDEVKLGWEQTQRGIFFRLRCIYPYEQYCSELR